MVFSRSEGSTATAMARATSSFNEYACEASRVLEVNAETYPGPCHKCSHLLVATGRPKRQKAKCPPGSSSADDEVSLTS
jgi:hypothetical protein